MTEAEKEAREEAERRYAPYVDRAMLAAGFVAGAQWQASRAPQPTDDDREALVNLIPLGFMERDPVRSVYEAADRILAAGFRRGAPAVTDCPTNRRNGSRDA